MKISILLLVLGLIIGVATPYFLSGVLSDGGIELPSFWSKARLSINFRVSTLFQITGVAFVVAAIVYFIFGEYKK